MSGPLESLALGVSKVCGSSDAASAATLDDTRWQTAQTTANVSELVERWRARSENLESWGASDAAKAFGVAADELERAIMTQAAATVNLTEASRESGYSADHLGRLVREGRIPNAGRKNAPQIRLQHLPRKPQVVSDPCGGAPDPTTLTLTRRAISDRR